MFTETKNDIWVTTYQGWEDYIYPIDFILGHDGEYHKGLIHYPDTGEKVYLEGEGGVSQFYLTEYNSVGQNIGELNIVGGDKLSTATWTSADGSYSIPIVFIEDRVQKYELPKSINLLAGSYYTYMLDGEIKVKCYRHAEKMDVHLSLNNSKVHVLMDMLEPGVFISNTDIELGSKILSRCKLVIQDEKSTLSFIVNNKLQRQHLKEENVVYRERNTYVTPYSKINIESLGMEYGTLTYWLNERLGAIVEDVNSVKKSNELLEYAYSDRNAETIGVNLKLTYFDKRYISGDVYTYGLNEINVETFIYDRDKDAVLEPADIINLNNLPTDIYNNLEGKNQLMISEKGLSFIGGYDIISGIKSYDIAFAELKNKYISMVKNRNFRKHFLK